MGPFTKSTNDKLVVCGLWPGYFGSLGFPIPFWKGSCYLGSLPLKSQPTNPKKKNSKKSDKPSQRPAVGRSDPPLKKQLLPTSKETQTRKQLPQRKATASLEVAVEVAGRKPRVLGGNFWPPKISRQSCRFSNPGGVTNIHGPTKRTKKCKVLRLPGREPQEMESTNCPTDSGYELLAHKIVPSSGKFPPATNLKFPPTISILSTSRGRHTSSPKKIESHLWGLCHFPQRKIKTHHLQGPNSRAFFAVSGRHQYHNLYWPIALISPRKIHLHSNKSKCNKKWIEKGRLPRYSCQHFPFQQQNENAAQFLQLPQDPWHVW